MLCHREHIFDNYANTSDGGKTTVRVNFDEHAHKIVSGDTITVNWNNSGTVYGQGYSKNIDLNINGVNVGVLSVATDKAVFTFNSNINDMENVTGWGEFDIQGRNLTNTSDENTGSFSIYSGGQQTDVSVTKPEAGSSPAPFYYKSGDMQPDDTDHVRWFLNINNERAYVSDRIYIKDQIQPGQTLDKSSFNITVDGYNNFYGSDAIEKFELAYPGSSISINESTGEITVIIPQDQAQLNSFSILYLTSVDDYNQPTFKNDSQAWYTENNQPAVYAQESDSSVSNVNANGGVDGKNQTKVSVIKEWADNNNSARLRPDSIKVQLYANGLLTGKAVTLNSANNWQYTWSGLVKNAKGSTVTYTVKEVSIPAGYTSTVDGYNITNTHKPTTPQVPNKPTTPKEPQVPNNGNKVTPKAYTQGKTYEKTGKLPQTGDESSMGMMLIGLVTLLLSLGLVVISRFTI